MRRTLVPSCNLLHRFRVCFLPALLISLLSNSILFSSPASARETGQQADCPVFTIDNTTANPTNVDKTAQMTWPIKSTTDKMEKRNILSYYPHHASMCFVLQNTTNMTQHLSVYLENPRMYHAELISQTGQDTSSSVIGTDYPLTLWEASNADAVFSIEVNPGIQSRHELLIGSGTPYNSAVVVMERDALTRELSLQKNLAGCLAGMIGILTIYFLFVAVSTRDKTYFYLAGSTASVTLMQLSDLGLLFPLWPFSLHWNQSCSSFFAVLSTLFGICLARHYLDTEKTLPRTDKALRLYGWYVLIVTMPLSLSNQQNMMLPFFAVPALGFMSSLLAISIIRIRQGFKPARLYLLAYLLPLVSGIVIFLGVLGTIPSTPMTHLLPIAGTAVQLILFALALGERINWLNEERDKAHYAALQAKTEMQTKRHFLAQISHELRTPLIGIIGLTTLIDRKHYSPADISLIDGMESSARHLLELTNTLLDHARLDAGKWTPTLIAFSIQDVVNDILDNARPAAMAKQLEINSHIHDNVPDYIVSDPDIVARILREIINNAIKFTSEGSIVVMVERLPGENSNLLNALRFEIMDTGIGFDPRFQSRLFEMFEIADASSTRQQQGSGLGLSLSKKFCTLLGGKIGCESHPNEGTLFWFRIPFALPDASTLHVATDDTRKRCHLREGCRILVAEDDAAIQLIVAALLDKIGSQNHAVFDNGKLLFEHYCQQPETVSFILLDWNMPIMDARQTLQAIRAFEASRQLPAVPVAIMSAHDIHSQLSLEPGMPVLYKPVSIDTLKQILNMV